MSVKKIFTRSGRELRKEFMGRARCCVHIHGVENVPTEFSSIFGMYTTQNMYGVTKLASHGMLGNGKTPEGGTDSPGYWVFDEDVSFEAPLQVSKAGVLQPIQFTFTVHGRETKDSTATVEIGTASIDLVQQSQLDEESTSNYFPVGNRQQNIPFVQISTSYHFLSEDKPKPPPAAAAAATTTTTTQNTAANSEGTREWTFGSLIASARSVFTDINSAVEDDEAKKLVSKGQQVFEKVATDKETARLLDRNLAIIENEIDDLAKTATGQEVKALVDHYSKKEETRKVLEGAEKLLEEVRTKPESRQLAERASKLLEKLEQDEISKKLAKEFQSTLTELTDEERRDLLIQRIGNEEQRAVMAAELHKTLLDFLKSDTGQAVMSEGGDLIKSGQRLLEEIKDQEGAKGLVRQLDQLLEDFEKDKIGSEYATQARRLVLGFVDDEYGKIALEKAEALIDKLASEQTDIRKLLSILVEEGFDSQSAEVVEARTLIEGIKDALVTYLTHHLPHIDIPPVQGHSIETPIGAVDYMVNAVSLSGLNLPESDIDLSYDPAQGISITATKIQVIVRDFTWGYRQSSWPHVGGVGLGVASVSGASINVTLQFVLEADRVTFHLKHNSIDIQDLQIEAVGSKTPWLYNFLLYVFKDNVKQRLETNINEAITENMTSIIGMLNRMSVPYLVQRVAAVADDKEPPPLPASTIVESQDQPPLSASTIVESQDQQ